MNQLDYMYTSYNDSLKQVVERRKTEPQVDEYWVTMGCFKTETPHVVKIVRADPEDVCLDTEYPDGTNRLIPRVAMLVRVEPYVIQTN